MSKKTAAYHLPGLFEFYEFYKEFLPLFKNHGQWFYDWCEIGSIYGAPADCLWGGGRAGFGEAYADEVMELMNEFGISARLTFSNSLLKEEHLSDKKCNSLCKKLSEREGNGVIVHSDLLASFLRREYPNLYLVSSTTKVLTDFEELRAELKREEFRFVVPDFRLNKSFEKLSTLSDAEKNKTEFLANECCYFGCKDRKACYEAVSRMNLSLPTDHECAAPDAEGGYRFSKAIKNPGFISVSDIQEKYLPLGFNNFKIEGRSLGSALLLEFLLYYMVRPEYQINVREELYLDNTLDLF